VRGRHHDEANERLRRSRTSVARRLPWVAGAVVCLVATVMTTAHGDERTGTSSAAATTSGSARTATATPAPPSAVSEWTPLIDQEFDAPAPLGQFDTVYPGWASYDGYHDTDGYGLYDSRRVVSVADGVLNEHLHMGAGEPLVVSITPVPHVQTYGRYEIRFRSDAMPSYKIAWLLWPADGRWASGEIDFPEAGLGNGDLIEGFSHSTGRREGSSGWQITTQQDVHSWHTVVIEWRPDSVTWILDGVAYRSTDPGAVPNVPMYWSMQTEADDPAASTSGDIQIDYVKAWAYTGRSSTGTASSTVATSAPTAPATATPAKATDHAG
jgi:hypothetical protein